MEVLAGLLFGSSSNRKMVLKFEFRAPCLHFNCLCDGVKRKLAIVMGFSETPSGLPEPV